MIRIKKVQKKTKFDRFFFVSKKSLSIFAAAMIQNE